MTENTTFDSTAWHFKRRMFSRGRPGTLSLRNGRLSFVTAPAGSATNIMYENDDLPNEMLFDLKISDIEVSSSSLGASLTIKHDLARHIIVFAVQSGSHFKDAVRFAEGLAALSSWRKVLNEEGVLV